MTDVVFQSSCPSLIVVDDFYKDPHAVRYLAMGSKYRRDPKHFEGQRSVERYLFSFVRAEFERLIGMKITHWRKAPHNGVFQQMTSKDPIVYNSGEHDYAAAVYLNPEHDAGISFWRHKSGVTRLHKKVRLSKEALTDGAQFHLLDTIAGHYNRLIIWDARLIHSAEPYYDFIDDPHLSHLFFFDVDKSSSSDVVA
jgi:Family of unknown function (DUF6445)